MWNNSEIKIVLYNQIVFYIGSQLDTFTAIYFEEKKIRKTCCEIN